MTSRIKNSVTQAQGNEVCFGPVVGLGLLLSIDQKAMNLSPARSKGVFFRAKNINSHALHVSRRAPSSHVKIPPV